MPSASTTIDERMLLNPSGGAVAVWGPTGLGVGYGHDSLQDGFYHEFWQSPPGTPLGTLVQAGFFELFSRGQCCQETLRTYALLGDPLTAPMVGTARNWIYAPGVTQ
ncbi:MAG: C25 family cysteine peptidase [Caldilineaceae bacterium]